jgi:hypothetical protein
MTSLSDFTNVERPADNDFAPLPEGWYPCKIDSIKTMETKAGDPMLSICYRIIDKIYEGRFLFDNFNLWHSTSNDAKTISLSKLWAIHDALNLSKIVLDAEQLVGRRLNVKVGIEDHWEEPDKEVNTVKGYKTLDDDNQPLVESKKPWEQK